MGTVTEVVEACWVAAKDHFHIEGVEGVVDCEINCRGAVVLTCSTTALIWRGSFCSGPAERIMTLFYAHAVYIIYNLVYIIYLTSYVIWISYSGEVLRKSPDIQINV
jgi:hypothetical protein